MLVKWTVLLVASMVAVSVLIEFEWLFGARWC